MTYEATRRVEASVRTFAIVEHLSDVGPAGISAIAAELDMSKGIVHNHVSTLRELGYITKVGDDYQLSPKFLTLGYQVRSQSPLYRVATDAIQSYTDRVDAGVVLFQQAGDEGIVIEARGLPSTVGLAVGSALSLSASLPGIVLLLANGSRPDEDHGYDLSALEMAFETDQSVRGPITSDSMTDCLAVSVTDADGVCHGSLGVVPRAMDNPAQLAESVSTLRDRIETGLQQEDSRERSFATEKHSWIGG